MPHLFGSGQQAGLFMTIAASAQDMSASDSRAIGSTEQGNIVVGWIEKKLQTIFRDVSMCAFSG
ncbi:MAG: hypothetical protein WD872_17240 [Pirellulaceae bacterium]